MVAIDSVRAKMRRAKTHLETLDTQLHGFLESNPQPVECYLDEDAGEKVWYVKGQPIQPPITVRVVIGDILYNMRSALDHLAWKLVEVNGETPTRRTAFPLSLTEQGFGRYWRTKTNSTRVRRVR